MKEINSRDFFDDSEAVISKVTSADALEEEDSKPDTSDTEEEEWVPKASRRAKFSKIIHSFMNSSKTMLTFSNALTTIERCLVYRISHQWQRRSVQCVQCLVFKMVTPVTNPYRIATAIYSR